MSGQPYTHLAHAQRVGQAARQLVVLSGQRVQILRRGVVYCARLCEPWTTPTGVDCWTVETTSPERARCTVPCKLVRVCGQADCACEPGQFAFLAASADPAFSQAGVVAPPESLNFEKTGVAGSGVQG